MSSFYEPKDVRSLYANVYAERRYDRMKARPDRALRRRLTTDVAAGDLEEALDLAERQIVAGLGYHATPKGATGYAVADMRYRVTVTVDVK
jgi:hypothetical protein